MAHGTPLGTGDNDERYGAQGAFLIEAGISSSYHIANFFGLTEWISQPKEVEKQASTETSKQATKKVAAAAPARARLPDLAEVRWPRPRPDRRPESPRQPRRRGIDVGDVITRALTAAGLMK
jgi:hypothetical protein